VQERLDVFASTGDAAAGLTELRRQAASCTTWKEDKATQTIGALSFPKFGDDGGRRQSEGRLAMSDTQAGPGWWLASDGKWYPPEQHASATAPPPPPTVAPPSRGVVPDRRATWLVLGRAIAASVGALMPWATVDIGIASMSKAGTSGDGIITLCIAVVVIILGSFGYQRGMTSTRRVARRSGVGHT